jgi:GTP1/Obg family GTP-binding protein
MPEQEHLLKEIETEFKGIPIFVVENKADLLSGKSERRKISAETGEGVPELVDDVVALLRKMDKESSDARGLSAE